MKRRTVLATTASATVSGIAGCSDFFSCGPGEDEFGDHPPSEVAERDNPVDISFEAEVDQVDVDGSFVSLVVSDGSGDARLESSEFNTTFDESKISEGDCLEATGSADPDLNSDASMLVLEVDPRDLELG